MGEGRLDGAGREEESGEQKEAVATILDPVLVAVAGAPRNCSAAGPLSCHLATGDLSEPASRFVGRHPISGRMS